MKHASTAIQVTTITALLMAFTTLCLAAECEPDCPEIADDRKATYEENLERRLDRQYERVGILYAHGYLSEAEFIKVSGELRELHNQVKQARADGKISGEEKKAIQTSLKSLNQEVLNSAHSAEDFRAQADRMAAKIAAGVKAGELTEAEKTALTGKLEAYRAALKQKSEGGLTDAERKELFAMRRQLNKDIDSERGDAEGKARKTANRDEDKVDERQRNQAGRLMACFSAGDITMEELKVFKQQQENLRKKEAQYLADGKLTAEEKDDLDQLLDQASENIAAKCEKKAVKNNGTKGKTEPGIVVRTAR